MKTDQIIVRKDGTGMEAALREAESFAEHYELKGKESMYVRLLTEETLGMVRALIDDYKSLFWIEGNGSKYVIHLTAKTKMDIVKREILLDVSKSGKNEAAKGVMGKIKDIFETAIESYEAAESTPGGEYVDMMSMMPYGAMGIDADSALSESVMMWSLSRYKESVDEKKEADDKAWEVWDELEKSIVANIADDVKVGIYKDRAELMIEHTVGKR